MELQCDWIITSNSLRCQNICLSGKTRCCRHENYGDQKDYNPFGNKRKGAQFCKWLTKNGVKCKYYALDGIDYCKRHEHSKPLIEKPVHPECSAFGCDQKVIKRIYLDDNGKRKLWYYYKCRDCAGEEVSCLGMHGSKLSTVLLAKSPVVSF